MPGQIPKTLVSGWGAGMSGLAEMLQQFLAMRMQGQEKEKDRVQRQKEFDITQGNEQKRLGMEQQRVGLEERSIKTNEAGVARSNVQGGELDPAVADKLRELFRGTPYEATLNNKTSLPSTQYGPSGSQEMEGKDYPYLQPTTAETNAESQRKRDMFLMDSEKARNARETADAPFKRAAMEAESEGNLERRMKLKHNFDMAEIEARIRETSNAGKKTDLADDVRALTNGYKALETITDDNDKAVATQVLTAYAKSIKEKYKLADVPGAPKDDIANLPKPPEQPQGPGLISQFLSGAGDLASKATSGIGDMFTTYLPQYCPPGSPPGTVCSKDGKSKQVGSANTRP